MKNRKYCLLFQTRNQYQLFEKLMFAKTITPFDDVVMLNQDCDSSDEEKELAKEVCKKYKIHWINENDTKRYPMQEQLFQADEWLTENGYDFDWIIRVHNDAYPVMVDFWDKLDKYLDKYEDLFLEKVGSFGFWTDFGNYYGRGNLEKEILEEPYGGWYRNLPQSWFSVDYSVVESPLDWAIGYNRKLLKKYVKIDKNFTLDHSSDDIAHQFLFNGIYNICFSKLCYRHDIEGKKPFTKFSAMQLVDGKGSEEFYKKWKHHWGWRNKHVLRDEFEKNCLNNKKYAKSIQIKLFNKSISDGPKDIEYYESLND